MIIIVGRPKNELSSGQEKKRAFADASAPILAPMTALYLDKSDVAVNWGFLVKHPSHKFQNQWPSVER